MKIQKIITDGVFKAVTTFNKEGKKIDGVKIQFTKNTPEFQIKVGKQVDEFIKTLDK